MQNIPLLNWKPVRDLCFVRELPVEQTGLIISGIDLNRSVDHSPVLNGIVEAVGPLVTDVQAGDHVTFEIGAGEFRIPGDDMVRIMHEEDIAWVDTTVTVSGTQWVAPLGCKESDYVIQEVSNGK